MDKTATAAPAGTRRPSYVIPDGPPPRTESGARYLTEQDTGRTIVLQAADSAEADRYVLPRPKQPEEAAFLSEHILHPAGHTLSPEGGVVCPALPERYRFASPSSREHALNPVQAGQARLCLWYLSDAAEALLLPEERGNLEARLRAMRDLARTVYLIHREGGSLYGLSDRNVLLDLKGGSACILMGLEAWNGRLIPRAPGRGDAMLPRYAPPEYFRRVQERGEPALQERQEADRHALSVLFYQLLLHRHPLEGPAARTADGAIREDAELYGSRALFVEHPVRHDNRPENLKTTIRDLGEDLETLFFEAFVEGLESPRERPTASRWLRVLERRTAAAAQPPREAAAQSPREAPPPPPPPGPEAAPQKARQDGPPAAAGEARAAGNGAPAVTQARTLRIEVGWEDPRSAWKKEEIDLDISAFLLDQTGRAKSNDDMVFYSAPRHPSGSIWIPDPMPAGTPAGVRKLMLAEFERIPPQYVRAAFAVSVYNESDSPRGERNFSMAPAAFVRLIDERDWREEIPLTTRYGKYSVFLLTMVRGAEGWEFQGTPEGLNGGLRTLCGRYGVQVQ